MVCSIGDKIKTLRQEKGISQDELALSIGSTKSAISRYESGKRKPSYETLHRIAGALGINTMEFFLGPETFEMHGRKLRVVLPSSDSPKSFVSSISDEDDSIGKSHISLVKSNQLLVALGLIQEGEDLSDADLVFLKAIIGALDTWFEQRHKRAQDAPQSTPAPQEGKDTTPPPTTPETPPEGE